MMAMVMKIMKIMMTVLMIIVITMMIDSQWYWWWLPQIWWSVSFLVCQTNITVQISSNPEGQKAFCYQGSSTYFRFKACTTGLRLGLHTFLEFLLQRGHEGILIVPTKSWALQFFMGMLYFSRRGRGECRPGMWKYWWLLPFGCDQWLSRAVTWNINFQTFWFPLHPI